MTKVNISDVRKFFNKRIELGETNYSADTLAFSYELGLPPNECTGMYVETDWEPEWITYHDDLVSAILDIKAEWLKKCMEH